MAVDKVELSLPKARRNLGEMLLERGLITPEQLEKALLKQREQGGKLSDILVKEGLVKEEDMAVVLSLQLNVPLIDLKRHVVQPEALKLIPESMARQHTLIPLDIIGDSLLVVMADPEDVRTIEDIKAQTRMRVEVALGIPSEIERAIDLYYTSEGEIEKHVKQFAAAEPKVSEITSNLIAGTPVAQSLNLIIIQAVRDRASDVHFEPQEDRLRIRYRIDGILHDMFSLPLSARAPLISRIKILAGMNIAEQRRPQDGQFSMKVGDKEIDIRVATMETAYGERATLRILDKSLSLFALSELGFLPDVLEKYEKMLRSPFGMILVGGPTGSGKTTTLYASIDQLDHKGKNIMTIEDPIEYRFRDITQTQVNPKAGITFASGLRALMRHDPDIILVGEIRDKDTATTAVQAALTGHLVLSSIHANDAVSVLFRLMDLVDETHLISSTLVGVIAQRMVRRICPHCRIPYKPTPEERMIYEEEMKEQPKDLSIGAGCNLCAHTGYQGRTGLFELLVVTEEIRRVLLEGASSSEIRAEAIREGMITMKRDGMLKVKAGITSMSDVLRNVFSIS